MTVADPLLPESEGGMTLEGLIKAHVDLVYGAALRHVRNPHLAADVTQAVFILLQKKRSSFGPGTILPAWLLRATRYTCLTALHQQRRRAHHERSAAAMRTEESPPDDGTSKELLAKIDEAVDRLSEADRAAIVLTYYKGMQQHDVARRMGITVDAAHKRVQRAVARLRQMLGGRGYPVPNDVITTRMATLSATGITPAAVTASVFAAAGGAPSATSVLLAKESAKMFYVWKLKWAAFGTIAAGVVVSTGLLLPAVAGQMRDPAAAAPATLRVQGATLPVAAAVEGIREVIIDQNGGSNRFSVDLESGKALGVPGTLNHKFRLLDWAADQGLDLMVDNDGAPSLVGLDMAVLAADNSRFTEMEPKRLVWNLGVLQAGTMAPMSTKGELPATYMFRTREGAMGMLQITKVEPGRLAKVTVRYKLLDPRVRELNALEMAEELMTETGPDFIALTEARGAEAIAKQSRRLRRTLASLELLTRGTKAGPTFEKMHATARALEAGETRDDERARLLQEIQVGWSQGGTTLLGRLGELRMP